MSSIARKDNEEALLQTIWAFQKDLDFHQFRQSPGYLPLITLIQRLLNSEETTNNIFCVTCSLVDPGGLGAWPPLPPDFFKIMQFSGNFKGKTPILSKLWAQGPLGSKLWWALLTKILDPPLHTSKIEALWITRFLLFFIHQNTLEMIVDSVWNTSPKWTPHNSHWLILKPSRIRTNHQKHFLYFYFYNALGGD